MSRTNSLEGLTQFQAVAEAGSFSAAARRLGVSPSAASQSVRALERRLGAVLFNRSTRSVALTEAGARYLGLVAPALRELQAADDEISGATSGPRGNLRLNIQRAAYLMIVQPRLGQFMKEHPEIDVEVVIDVGVADIVAAGFDVGIRFGDVIEKDMVSVHVGPHLSAHVLASPDYLKRNGVPRHPRDLLEHDCIRFRHVPSGLLERWEFEKQGERLDLAVKGRFSTSDSTSLVQAALDGWGITYMINGIVDEHIAQGRLVRILEDWSPPLAGFHVFYPSRRTVPRKLRVFIDFLRGLKSS